jgi:hypothetical protein
VEARRFLKWPGSKWSLARWILSHVPPHEVYLETRADKTEPLSESFAVPPPGGKGDP